VASKEAVLEFLLRFKRAAGSPARLILLRKHPGSENLACLLKLGITEQQAKEECFRLQVDDYSTGPEADHDPGRPDQEIWKFGPVVLGHSLYVKLVLTRDGRAKVLSFHFASPPLRRPFQKS
jgi:hypothetical protein